MYRIEIIDVTSYSMSVPAGQTIGTWANLTGPAQTTYTCSDGDTFDGTLCRHQEIITSQPTCSERTALNPQTDMCEPLDPAAPAAWGGGGMYETGKVYIKLEVI